MWQIDLAMTFAMLSTADKIAKQLGWIPEETFKAVLKKLFTGIWIMLNGVQHVQDGSYQESGSE